VNLYYTILAVIVVLTLVNLGTLAWVVWLQRLLREKDKAAAAIGRQVKASKLALGPKWDDMLLQVEESAKQAAVESVEEVTAVFNRDLSTTSLKINQQLEEQAGKLIQTELDKYQETFDSLRQSTSTMVGQFQEAIEKQRQELQTRLDVEMKTEKAKLMERFDKHLSAVVSSYLVEALGTEVDLGAQSKYLFRMLEDNKAALKQEILGEG
jgi:hypothetical protein